MSNALHVMNAGGHLSPTLENEVREVALAALTRQATRLKLDGVDVAVSVSPWGLPETGIFGYAPLDHLVQITLDPYNPNFAASWRTELPATAAHELHHARRWQGPGYGQTLLEVLVSEGLAQANELDERGGQPPPYARAQVDLDSLWVRTLPLLNRSDHSFEAWFYGSEAEGLPRWSGYSLGYELVRRHLVRVGGDAAGHVHTAAGAFRGAW
ncbi:DUF2268 domain-containing putative Zn-dependent protease [Deinococcus sp. AJ005]|uniref:DUF2268 domain-containing putative Zn-dependent protease n=1 Tax=Deinococcus sp. AJ005 TaxID=2652443 RepID=UPI001CF624A8|nr:DUF2268 domain-containing putative Zn-dependent protease [Deinococcus sp. AJ005]